MSKSNIEGSRQFFGNLFSTILRSSQKVIIEKVSWRSLNLLLSYYNFSTLMRRDRVAL